MYAIKLESDKSLVTTVCSTIYQGEKKADTLVFLLPKTYDAINLADCTLLLRYILPDGTGQTEELLMHPIPHNESYNQYLLDISTRFTEQAGEIELWLTLVDFNSDVVLESGTAIVTVHEVRSIEDYLPSEELSLIDRLAAKVNDLEKHSVNDLKFSAEEEVMQLTANGVPVGERVDVSTMVNKDDVIYIETDDGGGL